MPLTVTTLGESADQYEQRHHDAAGEARADYSGRIHELQAQGFAVDGEETTAYGTWWSRVLVPGAVRLTVRIERSEL